MTAAQQGAATPVAALDRWLFHITLPYWAVHGVDNDVGGFHERLDANRRPVVTDGKRALVQARQIYVFAQAFLLNRLPQGKRVANAGRDFLLAHYRHPDGGWRFRVARDGARMDDARDLYTQAFVLYALAWLHRLDRGAAAARALADETMAFLDRTMAHPKGGYCEALDGSGKPASGARRQNPHMHLFEACLEWYAATGDTVWRDRAASLAALLTGRFCVDGTLREYFDDGLAPLPGDQGRLVEPGHHYEWSWLLHRYRELGGGDHTALGATLYDFAERHGIDAATGGVVDAVAPDGTPLTRSRRLWPQTEAIKAHIARFEATGDPSFVRRIDRQVTSLRRAHIDDMAEGAWREHLDADGAVIVPALPASSLYHVTLTVAELARLHLP